jgi:hypothetical protein
VVSEAGGRTGPARSWWPRWPDWSGYAAAAWSIGYGALGAYWLAGGTGFPFGPEGDPSAALSILGGLTGASGAPAITILGVSAGLVGLGMARGVGRGWVRLGLVAFGGALAVLLAVLIPDYRVLLAIAYTPIFIVAAPFGWPPDGSLLSVYPWPVVNQFVCIGGGILWGAATAAYWRRSRGACGRCGRSKEAGAWTGPERARRWGRWATYVAVAIPIVYAITRWAWALGIPLGITEEFLREGQVVGLWWAGAALATLAVGGAALTLGLIQPWGETFPSWLPWIGGRRVPPMLAVVPAGLVALIVTSAGVMFWRLTLRGGFELGIGETLTLQGEWAAILPELLWPAWGVALALAALAYYYRRRGRCSTCGRTG